MLGAGHTDNKAGGGNERPGTPPGTSGCPGARAPIENAGVTIAGLQEVHGPQAKALADRYAAKWGMYPADRHSQNKVIWDRNSWEMTDARLVEIPYFGGKDVGMPLVQLTGRRRPNAGQAIWVWSIHNPANTHGNAAAHRKEALRRQLATMTDLAATGDPGRDPGRLQRRQGRPERLPLRAHSRAEQRVRRLGRALQEAQAGRADRPHLRRQPHLGQRHASTPSTQASKIADHPLVIATTAGSSAGCAVATRDRLQPRPGQAAADPAGQHPRRRCSTSRPSAATARAPPTPTATPPASPPTSWCRSDPQASTRATALAAYAKAHASELGIDYIIWYQRIWSVARAAEGWRPMEDRGSDTENHRDHVHINVKPGASVQPAGLDGAACDEVVYPVPAQYVGTDNHNWHETGALLVDLAHRHRLLRALRHPGLRRPRRHHRDRHHPGLGRPAAGQGHHRRRRR